MLVVVLATVKAEAGDSLEPWSLRPTVTTEQSLIPCLPYPKGRTFFLVLQHMEVVTLELLWGLVITNS